MGPHVESLLGAYEYEYWFVIDKEKKDQLLIHLLKEVCTDESFPLMQWLQDRDIPYHFQNYWTYK